MACAQVPSIPVLRCCPWMRTGIETMPLGFGQLYVLMGASNAERLLSFACSRAN